MMSMWWDLSLQGLMFVVSIGMYLWMNDHPRKLLHRYHTYRNRNKHQSRRHFVKSAELLSKARSYPRSSRESLSLAASSAAEADAAVRMDPTDAANHIIRALALELQGFKPSALEAIDVALSPLAAGSLSAEEKADALLKRAELRVDVTRIGRVGQIVDVSVWSVVESDLKEALNLNKETSQGWCLLGECYEALENSDLATHAFQEALRLQPSSLKAIKGLNRLGVT